MNEKKVNTGASIIKTIMKYKHISVSELAQMMTDRGFKTDSKVLSSKLCKDTFSLNEYVLFADILECDVKTIIRNENMEYINQCDIEALKKKKENSKKPKKEDKNEEEK